MREFFHCRKEKNRVFFTEISCVETVRCLQKKKEERKEKKERGKR